MNAQQALSSFKRAYPVLAPVTLTFTGSTPGWAEYLTNERQIRLHPDYDYELDPHLLAHEAGHAWHDLERQRLGVPAKFLDTSEGMVADDPVLDDFFRARGYPVFWLDSEIKYRRMMREGAPYPDAYRYRPGEALPEAFAALWLGYPIEQQEPSRLKVETYGVALDAARIADLFGLDPIAYLLAHVVTRGFGDMSFPQYGPHSGIDLAFADGEPLFAIGDGVVTVDDDDASFDPGIPATWSGVQVTYRLAIDGTDITVAHLRRNSVEHGALVLGGERIGECGSTGASTGTHVHFEARDITGALIDPLPYLEERVFGPEDRAMLREIHSAVRTDAGTSWGRELFDKINAGFGTTLLTWLRRHYHGKDPFTGTAPVEDA